ncbi:hypothetical protein D3C77_467410 [compost metagenome]
MLSSSSFNLFFSAFSAASLRAAFAAASLRAAFAAASLRASLTALVSATFPSTRLRMAACSNRFASSNRSSSANAFTLRASAPTLAIFHAEAKIVPPKVIKPAIFTKV